MRMFSLQKGFSNPNHPVTCRSSWLDLDAGRDPNGDESSPQPGGLLSQHAELLKQSGIAEEVQRTRGYRSVQSAEGLVELGFSRQQCMTPSLAMPIYDLDGKVVLYQARPDQPRTLKGKTAKYEMPKGQRFVVDVPPSAREAVLDKQKTLFITVGIRKADALVSRGECAVALLGPTGWKNQDTFWSKVPLEGRTVILVLDSDTPEDKKAIAAAKGLKQLLESKKATVRVKVVPTSGTGEKVGVDDYLAAGKTVNDLLAVQPTELSPRAKQIEQEYQCRPDGLYRVVANEWGTELQRLTTFTARIANELTVTDGVDKSLEYEIEAVVADEIKLITVPATEFEAMTWVAKHLGAKAIISAGYGIRDHVRAAIQQLSPQIDKTMVYTHTGWAFHNGEWVFLHAGGAIGAEGPIGGAGGDPVVDGAEHEDSMTGCSAEPSRGAHPQGTGANDTKKRPTREPLPDKDLAPGGTIGTIAKQDTQAWGIRVRLQSVLQGFRLPPPPRGDRLVEAVRASLDFINTAPDWISIPLFAAIWRAILGRGSYTLQLVGQTQFGKTAIAALAQQHFGAEIDAENLPAAWFATGNAILATAALAKDVLLTVDDFVPGGSRGDTDQAHRKAEMVLRAQGNHAGRARCRGDGSLVDGKAPQCSLLSTGEDKPDGQSLNSRSLILSVGPTDVNWAWVTTCQRHASSGLFAMAMAGFLQRLARDYNGVVRETKEHIHYLHKEVFHQNSTSSRTAAIAANLLGGLENFLEFALECGAITDNGFLEWRDRAEVALRAACQSHTKDLNDNDPMQRFRDLLAEAFQSGRAHVTTRCEDVPDELPEAWGWEKYTIPKSVDPLRSREDILEGEEQELHVTVKNVQDGLDAENRERYRHRGEKIGWWDCDDNLYLLPDVALAVVQRLAQASHGRPLPLTVKTLGKCLEAKGKLKSHRKGRHTKQIQTFAGQVSVLNVPASWVISWNPEPLTTEEQEENDKRADDLLA